MNSLLQFVKVLTTLVSPFLLQQTIDFVAHSSTKTLNERLSQGAVLLIALTLVRIASNLLSQYIDMQQVHQV